MIKKIILKIIRIYQNTLSPDTGWFSYKHPHGFCRFYPNCSEYGYRAIEQYGVFKGLFLSAKRVLRCNPFNKSGVDQVK
ncbi:membrane protein insertion efficiency factor YidD [Patescibacteria group bacterium]|nr:membrane protein insertion efficiency factor YidD [Patescibacteria group bacterium]